MRVEDILRSKGSVVITVHDDAPLPAAIEIMHRKQIGSLVVLDSRGRVSGVITERHVMGALSEHRAAALQLHVHDVMSRHVIYCGPEETIKKAAGMMTQHGIRHLPVMEEGQLRGIISMTDVVAYRLREMETETSVLRDIVLSH